jgi:hypothetical protein
MYCHEKTSCGGNQGGQRNVLPDRILPGIPSHGRASLLLMAWLEWNGDGLKHHAGELETKSSGFTPIALLMPRSSTLPPSWRASHE